MFALPFRSDRPRIRPSYMTIALIVVNSLIHLYSLALSPVVVPIRIQGQIYRVEESPLVIHHALYGNHPTFLTLFSHQW